MEQTGFRRRNNVEQLQRRTETFYREHHTYKKNYHRHKNNNDGNEPSPVRTKTNESDDSEQESGSSTRLAFNRIVPDNFPVNNKHNSQIKK